MKHHRFSREQNPASASPPTAAADLKQGGIDFVPSPDEVARRAYFTYVNQGSRSGHEVQHWLEAESQLIAERNLTRVHGFHNRI
jgi:Fe-S cluster biosynthesis and repair protein YggX